MGDYLLATRRWTALVSSIAFDVAGVLITSALIRGNVWREFLLLNSRDTFPDTSYNLSPSGFTTRMYLRTFAVHRTAVRLALVGATQLAVLAGTYLLTRQQRGRVVDLRDYGLWVAATLAVSPIVWLSYLALLVIPGFEIAARCDSGKVELSALTAMGVSAGLLFTLAPLFPFLIQSRAGRLIAEYQFAALALAYLSMILDRDRIAPAPLATR